MRVALDLDSTLAATSTAAFELMDEDYSYDDINSWSWGIDKFGKAKYLNSMWHAWTICPMKIPPMESGLYWTTKWLYDSVDQLDIVTAHPSGMLGVDEGKQNWLNKHAIVHDEYRSVDGAKEDLDYDIYIDDKPALAENVEDGIVLLRDQPYNSHIRESESVHRISFVENAVEFLNLQES